MLSRWWARCLVYPVLLCATGAGCQSLHAYRPVPILVKNAETSAPIAGVEVRISYPMAMQYFAPFESNAVTGADGIAHLRAAPHGDVGVMVELIAKGYMLEQRFLTTDDIQAIEPAGWTEDVLKRRPKMHVAMYAEPRPAIELVLPTAYRGLVKARIQTQDGAGMDSGARKFRYAVPASGEILVNGPALFKHVVVTDLRLCFADDTPLTPKAKGSALGYWWLKSERQYDHFLVGTQRDFDDFRRAHAPRQIGPPGSPGDKGSRWNRDPSQMVPASSPPGIVGIQQGIASPTMRDSRPSASWFGGPNP